MRSPLAWADNLAAPGAQVVGAVIPVDEAGLHCGMLHQFGRPTYVK